MWREEIGRFLQTLIFVALQFSIESELTLFGIIVSPLFALNQEPKFALFAQQLPK
jgi:hypothetical protein